MPGQTRERPAPQPAAAPILAQASPEGERGAYYQLMLVTIFGLGYIICSAGLIAYNKFLIHEERFPYAICLVLLHALFCSCFSFILYLVRPSLFPSLTDPAKKVPIDSDLIMKGTLPIAIFFSAQLVLTNTAYLHSSVAFLQMMKEGNLVLVYVLSLFVALETFNWRSVGILAFITMATTMTIHGEMNFSWTGFCIQGIGQVFECCKIVLQAMLLTQAGRKLDALSYVMLVMPLCAVMLGAGIIVLNFFPHEHFLVPAWHHLVQWWPHLLANACIAFALNVVIALFVKHSSAVSFILAGIVKDAMIVLVALLVLRELISPLQGLGFGLQLGAILAWSMIKTFPERFENGVLSGLASFVFGMDTTAIRKANLGKDQYGSTDDSKA
jgi:hypothetical protein